MSQTAPASEKSGKRASSPLVPPEERFWQRYSPHAEFPLSSAGSLMLHILAFGLLGLLAWLSAVLFSHATRSLPVEAVRLDLGGGGGNPHGNRDDGPNTGAPVEAGEQKNDAATTNVPSEDVAPLKIQVEANPPKPQFEDPAGRRIQESADANKVLQTLRNRTARIQPPNGKPSTSSYGKGGTGSGGGSGDGKGSGIGPGSSNGPGNLTQREKRNLRWSMLFNTTNSADYVAQLRGLGAILLIPVREDPNGGAEYKVVRDLSTRPAKLLNEDVNRISRMVKWVDDKPESVLGVMSVLGLNLRPSHFFAFMPEKLEQKLLSLELDYLHKHYRGCREDDIEATTFRILVKNGKYVPEVKEQKVR